MINEQMRLCRQYAAQAWRTENTSHIVMNEILCEEFAKILYYQIYGRVDHETAEYLREETER